MFPVRDELRQVFIVIYDKRHRCWVENPPKKLDVVVSSNVQDIMATLKSSILSRLLLTT